ncbi:TonB-dependent vitamin B12 receptor BtuB [soil metagenome]
MKFLSVIALIIYGFAFAPTRARADVIEIDEIIISSDSVAGSQAGPVTILSEKDLGAKKSQTIADVLREVTGLDVAQSGGSGQPASVFIRGAKSEHTLVLIDGVEANDPTTTTRFFDFSSLNVENIERIEIHRGASSVRFGADAIGGVINIITKKGSRNSKAEVSAEAGTYKARRLSANASGEISRFNYSAAVSHFATEGFSSADAGPTADLDGLSRSTVSTRLGWSFEDDSDLSFTLRVIDAATRLDASGGPAGDDPNYDSTSRQYLTGVTYRTLSLIPRVTSVFGIYLNSTNRKYSNLPDPARTTDYRENFESENLKVETRQIYAAGTASQFEGVLQYRREQGQSDQLYNGVVSALGLHEQSILGAALLYDTHFAGFGLAAGVRHDEILPIGESIFDSSVSLSYEVEATGTSLQTGYGTGFKNPSLFQLYSNFGSSALKSELAATFDISVEQKIAKAASVTLTYFQNSYSNLIDFDLVASKYANIASAKFDGAEIEVVYSPIDELKLKATGKILHAKDGVTGLELLRRPRWAHSFRADWTTESWRSSVAYRFTGDRDDLDPVSFQRIRLPSYALFDAFAEFAPSADWRIALRLENLANVSYQDVAGYRTSGRAFFVSVSRLWSHTD